MKYSKRSMAGIIVFISLSTSLLFYYNSTLAQTSLEKNKLNSNTIRIQNSLKEPLLDIQLIENTDQCLTDCYAIIKLHPYQRITFPETPNNDFMWEFLKDSPEMSGLKGYHFEILKNVSYQTVTPVFQKHSYICYNESTGKNETCWEGVQTSSIQETRYKDEYQAFAFWGETFEAGKDYYVKLAGSKHPALGENDIEWIPTFMGIRIKEWSWWNSNWNACRNLTIPANKVDNQALPNFPIALHLNSTNIDYSKAAAGGKDIRVVNAPCGFDGSTVPHEIENWDTTGESVVWFRADISASTSLNYSYYYNNSVATDAQQPNAVWNNSFVGVWHMYNDTSTNVPSPIANANGTITNTSVVAFPKNQSLGIGMNTTDYPTQTRVVNITNSTGFQSFQNFTVLAYVNFNIIPAFSQHVGLRDATTNYFLLAAEGYSPYGDGPPYNNQRNCLVASGEDCCIDTVLPLSFGTWEMIGFSYNSSYMQNWRDGTAANACTKTGTTSHAGWIAISGVEAGSVASLGIIDEVEIANVSRSTQWINMTYKSWTDSLITYGDEIGPSIANESEGNEAIFQGIQNALGPNVAIYPNQHIYIQYSNGTWFPPSQFDWVAISGNQTWVFNYVTQNETYTNMNNLNTRVYVWEKSNLSAGYIINDVSNLINTTKIGNVIYNQLPGSLWVFTENSLSLYG